MSSKVIIEPFTEEYFIDNDHYLFKLIGLIFGKYKAGEIIDITNKESLNWLSVQLHEDLGKSLKAQQQLQCFISLKGGIPQMLFCKPYYLSYSIAANYICHHFNYYFDGDGNVNLNDDYMITTYLRLIFLEDVQRTDARVETLKRMLHKFGKKLSCINYFIDKIPKDRQSLVNASSLLRDYFDRFDGKDVRKTLDIEKCLYKQYFIKAICHYEENAKSISDPMTVPEDEAIEIDYSDILKDITVPYNTDEDEVDPINKFILNEACNCSDDEEGYASDISDNTDIYYPNRVTSTKKKVLASVTSPCKSKLKTPCKSKSTTPSNVSLQTPTKLISRIHLNTLTPSVHRRTINIVKASTPLQKARQKLHVSVLPKSLPCREEEFNNIYSFLHCRLANLCGGCIYISGVPGTGKTATVNEVIRCLKQSVNAGKLNEFKCVAINGMKLSEPRQAYIQIWKQLSGNQATWEVALQSLCDTFTTAHCKQGMTLLLVDEFDRLCTKRQDVVYNLLNWPTTSTAKLLVVTIANTMDLPERIFMGKVTSRLGLTRLTFQPYNHKQLEEILVSRVKGYNAFNDETVQLVARKVAAISGDARRALDICRRASELAEMNNQQNVTMMHVKQALDEMIASQKIKAIKACSDFEKIFLKAVCAEVNRTGVEEVIFKNVYFQLETLCLLEGEKVPNVTEALSMCSRLGAWRLLSCDHSKLDIHQRVLLNVSTDDVYFAIKAA